ncbi:MAG TPA: tetraacyldisaccharide 4'-kinase [Phycisphaerales bacterium]|nr:tetraacyldisaccharide 4'-kinase [Phycisphaerales bacterium]
MNDDHPLPRPLRPFAGPLESLYRAGLARRSMRFDEGRGVVTIDRPVISVGNLSVGGTGKTPTVAMIAGWLLDAGHRPAIAMRGYRARNGISDEAAEYHARFGSAVPVVAQPDRLEGLLRLFATDPAVDVVILDDGFQHRRIARQMDIVLIDATRNPFDDRCLPAGWLREPTSALSRATDLVLTHTEHTGAAEALSERLGEISSTPLVWAEHAWSSLVILDPGGETTAPVDWLADRKVLPVCAIGRPGAFLDAVRRAAGRPPAAEPVVLRDHDPYRPPTIRRIIRAAAGADAIVTTEKDWSKLARVPPTHWPCPVARPRLEIRLTRGGDTLRDRVLKTAGTRIG